MARWTPLAEVLARAGSPEVLIRWCQEKFVVIRFAHAAYTNREGQPRRDDMTVPWDWWSLRHIHVTPDYIEFGRGLEAFWVDGVEFLTAQADDLLRVRAAPDRDELGSTGASRVLPRPDKQRALAEVSRRVAEGERQRDVCKAVYRRFGYASWEALEYACRPRRTGK